MAILINEKYFIAVAFFHPHINFSITDQK